MINCFIDKDRNETAKKVITLSTAKLQVSLFDKNRIVNPFRIDVTLCKSAPVENMNDPEIEIQNDESSTQW